MTRASKDDLKTVKGGMPSSSNIEYNMDAKNFKIYNQLCERSRCLIGMTIDEIIRETYNCSLFINFLHYFGIGDEKNRLTGFKNYDKYLMRLFVANTLDKK